MKNYYLVLLLVLFLFCSAISPQNIEIIKKENLLKLSEKWEKSSQQEKEKALHIAKQNGIPISKFSTSEAYELQEFKNGIPHYYTTNNIVGAMTISTDRVWRRSNIGYTLTGDKMVLGIWDGAGVRTTHQEFTGRVTQIDNPDSLHYHATHVAGTMVAAGIVENAIGMAYEAKLHAYDWNNDESEAASAAANGLLVSNHSYGEESGWYFLPGDTLWSWFGDISVNDKEDFHFGFYDTSTARWDVIANNAPYYLVVRAAGNDRGEGPPSQPVNHYEYVNNRRFIVSDYRDIDGGNSGYDCLPINCTGKNLFIVGAVEDIFGGYENPSDVVMSSFSSWGPTDDGRIKPDIVANGVKLYSATSDSDDSYHLYSGTSMASPCVSGSIGLLLEEQRKLHGDQLLLSSTIKAIVIQTADEAGQYDGPDYKFGWGLMNTQKAVDLMIANASNPDTKLIKEFSLTDGIVQEFQLNCLGGDDLRATICWNDPASTPVDPQLNPADLMLVNDIDLRIIDSSNNIYYPWILDPANPNSAATEGDNFRDNVEQVVIPSPEPGLYTIQISHKNSLQGGSQVVSLIATTNSELIQLSSPLNTMNNVSTNPTFKWNALEGNYTYNLQVSDTKDFSSIIIDKSDITKNYYQVKSLNENTQYFWRVRYKNQYGFSDWSNTWTLSTGPSPTEAGYSILMDGNYSYIAAPHSSAIDICEDQDIVTMEAWIYINKYFGGFFPIMEKYENSIDWGWAIMVTQQNGVNFNMIWSSIDLPYSFQLKKWTHVAITYSRSEGHIRLYINGNLVFTAEYDGDIPDTSEGDSLYIGRNRSGNDEYMNGMIDEFRIWSTVRTEQEIQDNMFSILNGNESGLVCYFNFDEGVDFQTADKAGDLETGKLMNEPLWMISSIPFSISAQPVLVSPENNLSDVNVTPEFIWEPAFSANDYKLQLSMDNSFSNIYLEVTTDKTEYKSQEIEPNTTYYWRVRSNNLQGESPWSDTWSFSTIIVEVEDKEKLPEEFSLFQNYPNPFNPSTKIKYTIPRLGGQASVGNGHTRSITNVILKVYDILGHEVTTLVNEQQLPGSYEVEFSSDSQHLVSGIYFYKLTAGSFIETKKMLLLK